MPSRRVPSRRLRVAGIASPVVLDLLGKNRGDYFQSMRLDDMDTVPCERYIIWFETDEEHPLTVLSIVRTKRIFVNWCGR